MSRVLSWAAALAMACPGAALADCAVSMSQASVAFGTLAAPAQDWRSGERELLLVVHCEGAAAPGFSVQAPPRLDAMPFGEQGQLTLSVVEARLDGEAVLLHALDRNRSPTLPPYPISPGDTWEAARVGARLEVRLRLEAQLPRRAWQLPEAREISSDIVISASRSG